MTDPLYLFPLLNIIQLNINIPNQPTADFSKPFDDHLKRYSVCSLLTHLKSHDFKSHKYSYYYG